MSTYDESSFTVWVTAPANGPVATVPGHAGLGLHPSGQPVEIRDGGVVGDQPRVAVGVRIDDVPPGEPRATGDGALIIGREAVAVVMVRGVTSGRTVAFFQDGHALMAVIPHERITVVAREGQDTLRVATTDTTLSVRLTQAGDPATPTAESLLAAVSTAAANARMAAGGGDVERLSRIRDGALRETDGSTTVVRLTLPDAQPATIASSPPAAVPVDLTKRAGASAGLPCAVCGSNLAHGLRFCTTCGHPTPTAPEEPAAAAGAANPPGRGGRLVAVAVIAALGVSAVTGFLVVNRLQGGDRNTGGPGTTAATGPGTSPVTRTDTSTGSNAARVLAGPVERLTGSANTTGELLAEVDSAGDLARVQRMAAQQTTLVDVVRGRLRSIPAEDADTATSRALLLTATGEHRRYLGLVAAAASTPARPERVDAVGTQADRVLEAYRAFFRSRTELDDAITRSGLARTGGLRRAVTAAATPRGPGPEVVDAARAGAEATIRRHWELRASGDFASVVAAHGLYTGALRSRAGAAETWAQGILEDGLYSADVTAVSVRVVGAGRARARADITTQATETGCKYYVITYDLISQGGTWRMSDSALDSETPC